MSLLNLTFGTPIYGWLPVRFEAGSNVVEFPASDVPNNPIQNLIEALENALQGAEASVWWNQEPDGYYFKFLPNKEEIEFQVLFAVDSKENAQSEVAAVKGDKAQVLLPIWRALRKFESCHSVEPHWPHVDYSRLALIKERLKGKNER
jgi:hypothetical protein